MNNCCNKCLGYTSLTQGLPYCKTGNKCDCHFSQPPTQNNEWEKEFIIDNPNAKFSDLAYYIDQATQTGKGFGTTPFSDLWVKDLIDFISTLLQETEARAYERGASEARSHYYQKVKVGQSYKDKKTGKIIKITQKATGNNHWTVRVGKGNSHHIHEGTLNKYYEQV